MIIASAQTNPHNKSIDENINRHNTFIEKAIQYKAQLITFPEMSLTGYEREKARALAFVPYDDRLSSLKKLSEKHEIIIIVGAPILLKNILHIGSFVLFPNGSEKIYTKQYLHDGEELAFQPSFEHNPTINIDCEKATLAICADITHNEHPKKAFATNSNLYLPSIFYTPGGMEDAYSRLSAYAKEYELNVLMSNYCGKSYGYEAGGESAFWNKKGELLAKLNAHKEGLLIVEKNNNVYTQQAFYF